jgi:hypothetical protein
VLVVRERVVVVVIVFIIVERSDAQHLIHLE